jgi:hypothetical protein
MLAVLVQPSPSETDTLNGIAHAFFSAAGRDAGPGFELAGAAVVLVSFVLLVLWVRREARTDRVEREALDGRHAATLSDAGAGDERREWVRVPAHLHLAVKHEHGHRGPFYETCETQSLGGGGLAFSTHTPPSPGVPIRFTLDLGEKRSLPLQGIVARVEPPPAEGAAHRVAVRLGPITAADREHIIRWVAHEEVREIADAHRGRLCSVCTRPLADDAEEMHSACTGATKRGWGPSSGVVN